MMATTDKPIRDYLAAFDLAAVFIAPGGDVLVGLDPGAVDAAWWTTRRDAHRVARRAKAMSKPDILAAARDLDVALTEHRVAVRRARAAVERIGVVLTAAQNNGDLKFFNSEYRRRRVAARAAGRRFMTYTVAVRRLRAALAGAAAKGEVTAGVLAQVFGPEEKT
jgi:hypothetical protein